MSNDATEGRIEGEKALDSGPQLLLGGLPPHPSLFRVRVTRAELAAILNTSKATVTRWCQRGRLTFAPDGRIDAAEAIRQLLRSGDPRVLRVGLFRQAMVEVEALRVEAAKAAALDAEMVELRTTLAKVEAERDRLAVALAEVERFADTQAAEHFKLRPSPLSKPPPQGPA